MAVPRSAGSTARGDHPWRIVIVVGIFCVAGTLAAIAINSADTTPQTRDLPVEVEGLVPAPGQILEDAITADLRDDLTGVLQIDRVEVPEDQTIRVPDLGQVTFRPGPDTDITRFAPGEHTVTVLFWPADEERPDNPGAYSWRFKSVD